jgi:U2 small nuclear ribonucleoprotein A'
VIARLPRLKVLDFRRVTPAERAAAAKLAGADGSALDAVAEASRTFEPGEGLAAAAANGGEQQQQQQQQQEGGEGGEGDEQQQQQAPRAAAAPTAAQLTAIKAAIANAQTLEEAERLEAALREGKLPSELAGGGQQEQQQQSAAAPMDEG